MKKQVSKIYTILIQDMYEELWTSATSLCGVTEDFKVGVVVHQGSALNFYFNSVVMEEITKNI